MGLLDRGSLRQFQRIFDIDAEMPNRAVNFYMAQKNLNGTWVPCCFIDNRCLRAPK